jgi:hypothetical protein
MARVIEFYVPKNFKPTARWVPPDQRGRVVEFPQHCGEEVRLNCSGAKDELAWFARGEVRHVEDLHC